MSTIWILVAESSRAKLFSAETPTGEITEVEDWAHPESRLHEREITSDLPGSNAAHSGASHHSLDDKTSAKEQEEIYFAKEISEKLEQARNSHQYKKLLIAAAPDFLGVLRKNLGQGVKDLVSQEIDKNLAHMSTAEIRTHLPDRL